MKAIFISDNDRCGPEFERVLIGNFVKLELISFSSAEEAIAAIPEIKSLQFCVIDVNHRKDNLQELFHHLYLIAKNRPIFFVGPAPALALKVPHDFYSRNMVNEALEIPYDIRKFCNAIRLALDWTAEQVFYENTFELDPSHFVAMKIGHFYRQCKIPFDAYVEIERPKFVRIIHKNEPYRQALITKYIRCNTKFLYLEKNEGLKYLEEAIEYETKFFNTKNMTMNKILEEQIRATSVLHEYIRVVGVTSTITNFINVLVKSLKNSFEHFPKLHSLFSSYPKEHNSCAARSIFTAYVSLGILEKLGWNSHHTRNKLCFASIIHDIYAPENMLSIKGPEEAEFERASASDQKDFMEHAKKAAELASFFSRFPETSFIITQHHDLPNGRGLSSKAYASQLTPLSCIFIISTDFVNEIYQNEFTPKSALRIIKNYLLIFKDGNFRAPVKALMSLFN